MWNCSFAKHAAADWSKAINHFKELGHKGNCTGRRRTHTTNTLRNLEESCPWDWYQWPNGVTNSQRGTRTEAAQNLESSAIHSQEQMRILPKMTPLQASGRRSSMEVHYLHRQDSLVSINQGTKIYKKCFGDTEWTYQQDSALVHKAKAAQEWWKAYFPDLMTSAK